MERILKNIYNSPGKMKLCKIISAVSAYVAAAFFGVQLLMHLLSADFVIAAAAAGSAALGFVLVTVMRKIINLPRPYEVYSFYDAPSRDKKGESFPSRHCYSASVIAVLGWLVSPLVTVAVGLLTLLIAITRVVTGIHFVRDVLCGIALGLLFGGAGLALAYLI